MAWPPGVSDFKAQFFREFQYGNGLDKVTDKDIQRGLNEANSLFNQSLFDSATDQVIAYLFLAAHMMVVNIQQAAGGLSAVPRGRGTRNVGQGVVVAAGIGPSQLTFQQPPEKVANSPVLLMFFQTVFGQRYSQMIAPRLVGNMLVVGGPNDNFPSSDPTVNGQ